MNDINIHDNEWPYPDDDGDELEIYGFHELPEDDNFLKRILNDEGILESLLQEYKEENNEL
ncbi:hypothetical protein CMI47_12935 [Candidatus Pacearchaeota archaeon]|nr:hypothetical protein [Candidatus Pacearchaeota archaeon]|tara:strand:- start:232 stop:414 length:183 start_codon:yes stop_codon:yes gene_type:complete